MLLLKNRVLEERQERPFYPICPFLKAPAGAYCIVSERAICTSGSASAERYATRIDFNDNNGKLNHEWHIRRQIDEKAELYAIFGADCLESMPNWKFKERIFRSSKVIVVARGQSKEECLTKLSDKFTPDQRQMIEDNFVGIETIDLSSTNVRARLFNGIFEGPGLPPLVEGFIRDQNLYRGEKTGTSGTGVVSEK